MESTDLPEVTRQAIEAIGAENDGADWILRPDEHISLLANKQKAGALVRILESTPISAIADQFKQHDARANELQKRYKRLGRIGIYATLAASLIGALFLLPFQELLEIPQIKGVALAAQFAALGLAFFASIILLLIFVHELDKFLKDQE